MNYHSHQLLKYSEKRHQAEQPHEDQTPSGLSRRTVYPVLERAKRFLGYYLYPAKNAISRNETLNVLSKLSGFKEVNKVADVVSVGHKGFAQEIFLNRISKVLGRNPDTVLCFGCGMGDETLTVAKHLRPKRIVGIDYFNFHSYWELLKAELKKLNIEAVFFQFDHLNPKAEFVHSVDLIYSHAVLEHLKSMDETFSVLKNWIKPNGYFAAQWGPMWNSYSGDHISGELGLDKGFAHLQLTAEDYFNYYRKHPRNVSDVEAGKQTWLELGLHNFATYSEYIAEIEKYFGNTKFLQWVISPEALAYKKEFPDEWNSILNQHKDISELDLALSCAGILAGH